MRSGFLSAGRKMPCTPKMPVPGWGIIGREGTLGVSGNAPIH